MDNLNNKHIFLTGGTGFLGAELLRELITRTDSHIYMLIREKACLSAHVRFEQLMEELYDGVIRREVKKRITVIPGALDKPHLGMTLHDRKTLIRNMTTIIHSAAISSFGMPLDAVREINVQGVENLLQFAEECAVHGELEMVNHISTTYVVGARLGLCYENELREPKGFNNTYEQSKYEGELVVKQYRDSGIPINIYRPAILMGHSQTGATRSFKMFYKPLHFFAAELFDEIPATKEAFHSFIPIDAAAQAMFHIMDVTDEINQTYHIVNNYVSFDQFITAASQYFGFRLPRFVNPQDFDIREFTPAQRMIIESYLPYFNYRAKFDARNAQAILDKVGFTYPPADERLLMVLFKFCEECRFLKRKKIK